MQNVTVYVLDEHLQPVPLGAPGLICFSGVCVGRGYVNDPERTAAVYLTDPHRPGQRLYKGGDHGRWRPDGKLEFLGRRDSQVKISGFRIELGEIDNTLLRVPGVRDGAVVVAERPDRGKQLVAFYTGPRALDVEVLRGRLGASLPHYMIPAAFHRREALPLTAERKNRHQGAGRARGRARRRRGRRRRAAGDARPSSGSPPPTRPCSASRSARSAATTTSSTAAAPRCSRSSSPSPWSGRSRSRTSPATRSSPTWPSSSTAGQSLRPC